jgi:hypothetical protein
MSVVTFLQASGLIIEENNDFRALATSSAAPPIHLPELKAAAPCHEATKIGTNASIKMLIVAISPLQYQR